jgi:hypothetical protein
MHDLREMQLDLLLDYASNPLGVIARVQKLTSAIPGHFALETHVQQIASTMLNFLERNVFVQPKVA